MQRIKASFAVGLNCPVSIELIVFLETPTISAKALCDKPFSVLVSFSLFFNINELADEIVSRIVHERKSPQILQFLL